MEFRRGHLLYFITVAEEGQITRAASKLHLAQPALSQAIAQLESDLGIELLRRHARGVALTPAGEAFLEKARVAVAAWSDAVSSAQSLAPGGQTVIEFGFVGSPPALDSPAPLNAFTESHPHVDLLYRELPFPSLPTASWLSEVDVAVCHRPHAEADVWMQRLRREGRTVLASKTHALADRTELRVADVMEETYIGFHPDVDPEWAGFWSLDDHRGGPPPQVTRDRVANAQEVLASLPGRGAITTVPSSVARVILNVLSAVVAIPLLDADPCEIVFAGRTDRRSAQVAALLAFSARGRPGGPAKGPGGPAAAKKAAGKGSKPKAPRKR